MQLRLRVDGTAELRSDSCLPCEQHSSWMRFLQVSGLVQHAVPVERLVNHFKPSLIYSPYTDKLLAIHDRPQIITCHDLTPLYWPSSRRAYWRSRLWLPRHIHGADRVVAISHHVADLLLQEGLPAQRIAVIPNGVEAVADPLTTPAGPDLLMLARHARNKNISLALQGFARFLTLNPNWEGQLVIVGRQSRETALLLKLEQQLGLEGRICWYSSLSADALERRWRASFALISTSWMEGFDYPLLEAQAHGLPTLASKIPVHEELYRDIALLVDCNDDGVSLAAQLQRLARNPGLWQQLSQAGLQNARYYSLERQCRSLHQLLGSLS